MKNKLFLSMVLLSVLNVFAKPVKLPSAEILTKRFEGKGFDHFIEKTNIVEELADKTFESVGVALKIELALHDYNENLQQPMMSIMMQMRKPEIFEIVLKDSPEAIEELKKLK
ncbi:MAG: hypothetical protein WDZ41_03005 [Candidatus Babeliales bacterium]